jgi:hypothetical protein
LIKTEDALESVTDRRMQGRINGVHVIKT